MIVYIVKRQHTDGCDYWTTLVDVTLTYEGAISAMNENWEGNKPLVSDFESRSWELWYCPGHEYDEYYIELKELTR